MNYWQSNEHIPSRETTAKIEISIWRYHRIKNEALWPRAPGNLEHLKDIKAIVYAYT